MKNARGQRKKEKRSIYDADVQAIGSNRWNLPGAPCTRAVHDGREKRRERDAKVERKVEKIGGQVSFCVLHRVS